MFVVNIGVVVVLSCVMSFCKRLNLGLTEVGRAKFPLLLLSLQSHYNATN